MTKYNAMLHVKLIQMVVKHLGDAGKQSCAEIVTAMNDGQQKASDTDEFRLIAGTVDQLIANGFAVEIRDELGGVFYELSELGCALYHTYSENDQLMNVHQSEAAE